MYLGPTVFELSNLRSVNSIVKQDRVTDAFTVTTRCVGSSEIAAPPFNWLDRLRCVSIFTAL